MRTQGSTRPDLHDARVVIIGVGGLGSPAAMALADAGVGTIGLVDPDRVEPSNLHRQPLYGDADIGRLKVEAAAAHLQSRHPRLRIEAAAVRFAAGAATLLADFDLVVDGTDSVGAKFAVNDAILLAVEQTEGIACHTGRERCFFQRLEGGRWVSVEPVVKDPRTIYGHD